MKRSTFLSLMRWVALTWPAWIPCRGSVGASSGLEKDSHVLFDDPLSRSPVEFCQALRRHYPVLQIIEGKAEEEEAVREKIRQASLLATNHATARIVDGKVNTGVALLFYLSVMLRSDCPKEERLIFCQFVEALLKLHAKHPDDVHCTSPLISMLSSVWMGWFGGLKGWKDTRSAISTWHASEIYQHLLHDVPATSAGLIEARESVAKRERKLAR